MDCIWAKYEGYFFSSSCSEAHEWHQIFDFRVKQNICRICKFLLACLFNIFSLFFICKEPRPRGIINWKIITTILWTPTVIIKWAHQIIICKCLWARMYFLCQFCNYALKHLEMLQFANNSLLDFFFFFMKEASSNEAFHYYFNNTQSAKLSCILIVDSHWWNRKRQSLSGRDLYRLKSLQLNSTSM